MTSVALGPVTEDWCPSAVGRALPPGDRSVSVS
jgi:hypothetical protein